MRQTERGFYIAGWCVVAAVAAIVVLAKWKGGDLLSCVPRCPFHALTGFYCPGCGGTRALRCLLQGNLLQSFRHHPLVPYTAVLGGWFMVSHILERISGGRLPIGMRLRSGYLWIALVLVIANVLLKNITLLLH